MESLYRHDDLTDPKSQIRLLKIQPTEPDAFVTRGLTRRLVDHAGRTLERLTLNTTADSPSGIPKSVLIKCTVETFDMIRLPSYRALSYVWGSEDMTSMIRVNRRPFRVRENLWHFLHQIASGSHSYAEQWLWIDQICIAQNRIAEKGHQVGLMRRIFSNADEVLCWLGPAAEESELAIQYLSRLGQAAADRAQTKEKRETLAGPFDPLPGIQSTLEEATALLQFFARPYWQRLWVVQELYLAKTLCWICGADVVYERIMACAIDCLRAQCQHDEALRSLEWSTVPILSLHFQEGGSKVPRNGWPYRLPRRTTRDSSNITFQTAIGNSLRLQCALPHDHIYGILALSRHDIPTIVPDYTKPAADAFWEALPLLRRPLANQSQIIELGLAMGVTGREAICRPGKGSLPLAFFRTLFREASPEKVFAEARAANLVTQN